MELLPMKHWYDARDGWVELQDDVLSIVRQVRELYGNRITIELAPGDTPEPYAFVEHCEDTTDRLIFTCATLDGRAIERLQRSDSHSRVYVDPYEESEREHDRISEEFEENAKSRIRAIGEQIAHALKREGRAESLPLTVGLNSGNRQRTPSAHRRG